MENLETYVYHSEKTTNPTQVKIGKQWSSVVSKVIVLTPGPPVTRLLEEPRL